MPRLGIRLTASLCRVYADERLASDIGKRIEHKSVLIGSSLVQLFHPREYTFFLPNPCPYILRVECDGAIEVYSWPCPDSLNSPMLEPVGKTRVRRVGDRFALAQ